MRKSTLVSVTLTLAFLLLGITTAHAGVSISIGTDNFYLSVGDYDYLPYAYNANPYAQPRINFHEMMSQYGVWLPVQYFGLVWKPYASYGWRPYLYGHWIYTQYGPTWEGYEPWAWVGYHYGDWIFDRQYGWVWIPGYDWHPCHVIWARSYDSIGWMPAPPWGYDYSRGYLSNVGPNNQFSYDDPDFGNDYGAGNYTYGGPYYDPRYRDMYYNPSYSSININLWIFINNTNFGNDDYANSALGTDYARHVFDRNLVKITSRQMDRNTMERLVGQRIQEMPVDVRELRTDKQSIKVVVPRGSEAVDRIRKHSGEVVREVIAPGFAEKQKSFRGLDSTNKVEINRLFHQEKVQPRVQTLSPEQVIDQAREAREHREQIRITRDKDETEKLIRIEKEGKIQKPSKEPDANREELNQDRQENNNEPQQRHELEKRSDDAGKPNQRQDIVTAQPENKQTPVENEPVVKRSTDVTQESNLKDTRKESGQNSQLKSEAGDRDKKKDSRVDVKAALMADKSIDASHVDVHTDAGTKTVTLKGTVPTVAQKEAAEKVARHTAQGYKVLNLLTVAKK